MTKCQITENIYRSQEFYFFSSAVEASMAYIRDNPGRYASPCRMREIDPIYVVTVYSADGIWLGQLAKNEEE